MGRSVMVPQDAIATHYHTFDGENELDAQWLWEEHLDDLRGVLKTAFPSFTNVDRRAGRETHIILENDHAGIAVCEYCGLVSVSIASRTPLGRSWCERLKFVEILDKAFGGYVKLGTASNGESFYQRKGG